MGALTTHTFEGVGNQTKRTDGRGWVTTYTLDSLNRTVGQAYRDVTGITTNLWDNAGRQVGVINGQSKALTYTLDAVGNRTGMVDPDAGLTTYTWDIQNRLTGIVNPYNEFTTMQYDALDREQKKTLGNGMTVSHLYDGAGREISLWNVSPAGVGLALYTASYDAVGNRTGVQELDGTRVTFGYDSSCQLVNEQRSGANAYNTTYLYDGTGNRTLKNDSGALTTCLYNVADELTLLTPPTGQPTTSAWDANGNLASENAGGQLTTYSWDGENRLTGVAYPSGAPDTFSYSNDGLRQRKVTGAGVVEFVWDDQNVLVETDSSGVTQAHYTDHPGMWGGLSSQRRSGASSFFGFDQQSNSRLLAPATGAISDSYLYEAFGEELAVSGSTVNPLRFGGRVGYYRDLAARLYIRARHVEPGLGRWMSRDPLGWSSHESPYCYALNCPIVVYDPSGERGECGSGSGGECASYPGGPCAWVKARWPRDTARVAGLTVCCGGKRIICHYFWSDPRIVECIIEHEKCHWPDEEPCDHDGLDLFREGVNGDASECRCHQVEMRCLLEQWRKCRRGTRRSCDRIFRKRFQHVCHNADTESNHHCRLPPDLAAYCRRGGL